MTQPNMPAVNDTSTAKDTSRTGRWLWHLGALGNMMQQELSEWSEEGM
jgi:hypothetical protein